jgi:hypothetical protein
MVATESIEKELKTRKFRRLVRWSRGVDTNLFRPYGKDLPDFSTLPRPILLYVGRVTVEKNLREYLDIDTVGSQIVVGDGPDLASLEREYPDAYFLGALSGEKLARHYAAADLFVFPSIADTFGLVLLEACAAGLRVAAKPVPGPSDIFADNTAKDFAALDWDLGRAVETALQLRDDSEAPRAFAQRFTWQESTQEFYAHLQAPAPKFVRSLTRWRKRIADQLRSAGARVMQNRTVDPPARLIYTQQPFFHLRRLIELLSRVARRVWVQGLVDEKLAQGWADPAQSQADAKAKELFDLARRSRKRR